MTPQKLVIILLTMILVVEGVAGQETKQPDLSNYPDGTILDYGTSIFEKRNEEWWQTDKVISRVPVFKTLFSRKIPPSDVQKVIENSRIIENEGKREDVTRQRPIPAEIRGTLLRQKQNRLRTTTEAIKNLEDKYRALVTKTIKGDTTIKTEKEALQRKQELKETKELIDSLKEEKTKIEEELEKLEQPDIKEREKQYGAALAEEEREIQALREKHDLAIKQGNKEAEERAQKELEQAQKQAEELKETYEQTITEPTATEETPRPATRTLTETNKFTIATRKIAEIESIPEHKRTPLQKGALEFYKSEKERIEKSLIIKPVPLQEEEMTQRPSLSEELARTSNVKLTPKTTQEINDLEQQRLNQFKELHRLDALETLTKKHLETITREGADPLVLGSVRLQLEKTKEQKQEVREQIKIADRTIQQKKEEFKQGQKTLEPLMAMVERAIASTTNHPLTFYFVGTTKVYDKNAPLLSLEEPRYSDLPAGIKKLGDTIIMVQIGSQTFYYAKEKTDLFNAEGTAIGSLTKNTAGELERITFVDENTRSVAILETLRTVFGESEMKPSEEDIEQTRKADESALETGTPVVSAPLTPEKQQAKTIDDLQKEASEKRKKGFFSLGEKEQEREARLKPLKDRQNEISKKTGETQKELNEKNNKLEDTQNILEQLKTHKGKTDEEIRKASVDSYIQLVGETLRIDYQIAQLQAKTGLDQEERTTRDADVAILERQKQNALRLKEKFGKISDTKTLEESLKNLEKQQKNDETSAQQARDDLGKLNEQLADAKVAIAREEFYGEGGITQTISVSRALLRSYEQFPGLARLGSLFLTGDTWEEYRNDVSEAFCKTVILGGKQCWVSKICDNYIETTPAGNSLIARTPAGLPRGVVHLQAEKSLPIDFVTEAGQTGKGYIYKITYSITNPHEKTMTYNLQFKTKKKTYTAFEAGKTIQSGQTDGRLGAASVYQQSINDYTDACITFTPPISTWDGKIVSQYCARISQYHGAATKVSTPTTQEQQTRQAEEFKGF